MMDETRSNTILEDLNAEVIPEVIKLRADNQVLNDELTQCQADKEFVWSLWKRLQIANPDVTQAVTLVVQREKEKSEVKDRKVLEILHIKDRKIEELQKSVQTKTDDYNTAIKRKVDFQNEIDSLTSLNSELNEKVSDLDNRLHLKEGEEKSSTNLHKKLVQSLEREKQVIEDKLERATADLGKLKSENADVTAVKVNQEHTIKSLERDVKEIGDNFERMTKQLEDSRKAVKKHSREIGGKNNELETVRNELTQLWENHAECNGHAQQQDDVIRQLQSLQKDTEQIVQNQESAYTIEMKSFKNMYTELSNQFASMKDVEAELRQKSLEQKEKILSQEEVIHDLHKQLEEAQVPNNKSFAVQADISDKGIQSFEPIVDVEYRLQCMEAEIDMLKDRLKMKNRQLTKLEEENDGLLQMNLSPIKLSTKRNQAWTPSLSPSKKNSVPELQRTLNLLERKLENTHKNLKMKTKELDTVKIAHSKRLERLKTLQHNYRLQKEELKTYQDKENELKKKKKIKRAEPKDLQREENTDAVWNELTYFKNENKNLVVERMNLQEELDLLRVQTAQDAATIHELRVCLEQEKDELEYLLREREQSSTPKRDLKSELNSANKALTEKNQQIADLEAIINKVEKEKELLLEQQRDLRDEIVSLKKAEAGKRILVADFKYEINKLEKEVESLKGKRLSSPVEDTTVVAKKYQKTLNKSIEKMSRVFDHFCGDEWQNVSDSETQTSDESSDSLGIAIVQSATDICEPPSQDSKKSSKEPVSTRDFATSPLKNLAAAPINPVNQTTKTAGTRSTARQIHTLKLRLGTLQQQIRILKTGKTAAMRSLEEQRALANQLQSDLILANQRLKMSKQNIQKLTSDVEKHQRENGELQSKVDAQKLDTTTDSQHTEQEWKNLENRLKISSTDVSKQLTTIKQLRNENQDMKGQTIKLEDKISRLERDNSQKRLLVDDMKIKLKIAQENLQSDSSTIEDMEIRVKTLTDINDKSKTHNESLRRRLSAITKERHGYEDLLRKKTQELEKKSKKLSECLEHKAGLEVTINEVESTAKKQLQELADRSEVAIEAAQNKLIQSHNKIQQFEAFTKTLAHHLLVSTNQARSSAYNQKESRRKQEQDKSLKHASNVAKTILNISQSELDNLLNTDDDNGSQNHFDKDLKADKKWNKRWQKIVQFKSEFSIPLAELFTEKIEERIHLLQNITDT